MNILAKRELQVLSRLVNVGLGAPCREAKRGAAGIQTARASPVALTVPTHGKPDTG